MPWLKKKSLPQNEPESIYAELDDRSLKFSGQLLIRLMSISVAVAVVVGLLVAFNWHFGAVGLPSNGKASTIMPGQINRGNGLLYVNLSADQLNQVLSQLPIPIIDLSTTITNQQIDIKGLTRSLIQAPVKVSLTPSVNQSHKIIVTVDDLTVAGIRMLPLATTQVQNEINQSINNYVNQQLYGQVESISLSQNNMQIGVEP